MTGRDIVDTLSILMYTKKNSVSYKLCKEQLCFFFSLVSPQYEGRKTNNTKTDTADGAFQLARYVPHHL